MSARILVIDDDPDSRALLRLTLEDAGYGVSEAKDGRRGLEVLELAAHDLVLLDLQMPVMSGRAFVEELARRGETQTFGVIAMSGHFDARSSPAKWFLAKPVDVGLLLAVVAEFCGRRVLSALWARDQQRESLTALGAAIDRVVPGGAVAER